MIQGYSVEKNFHLWMDITLNHRIKKSLRFYHLDFSYIMFRKILVKHCMRFVSKGQIASITFPCFTAHNSIT